MNNRFITLSAKAVQLCSLTGLLLLPLPSAVLAVDDKMQVEVMLDNKNYAVNNRQWAQWLVSQVKALPALQALEKGALVAQEQQKAMQQAIYNPELDAFYTDKKDDEYGLIISQTIDLFDKRSVNSQLGADNSALLALDRAQQTEAKLAGALQAYIEYLMAQQLLNVARKQEQLLLQISADLSLREAAGDVGQVDAEMAYLSLSQNLQQISLIEIRFRKARAQLKKTLNSSRITLHPQPEIWFNELSASDIQAKAVNGLSVQYARKRIQQSMTRSKIAQLNKKTDPTIGLGAGRDGQDNTLMFEFSIPLNVRNNFSAQYNAVLHQVTQAELELKEQQRLLKTEIEQSFDNYHQLKKRVISWRKLTGSRLKNSQKLLNKQWKSGDISTSDYLFSMRQRSDTLIANIELKGEMQKAWVEWLLASSQVQNWLESID